MMMMTMVMKKKRWKKIERLIFHSVSVNDAYILVLSKASSSKFNQFEMNKQKKRTKKIGISVVVFFDFIEFIVVVHLNCFIILLTFELWQFPNDRNQYTNPFETEKSFENANYLENLAQIKRFIGFIYWRKRKTYI